MHSVFKHCLPADRFRLSASMIRFIFLSLCLCLLAGIASAQDNLTGRIYEYKTKTTLPGISVRNLRTNGTSVSDRTGAYSIQVKVGDLVVFAGFSYQLDTLYVKEVAYTDIQMILKSNMLQEVKVTGQEVKLGNLKAAPTLSPINSDALTYSKDASGNYTGGLTASIFDSHSAAKKRQHDAQTEKDEAMKAKIADLFKPQSIENYVPLKGQEMVNFLIMYTPDLATYTAPDFNLTIYLNTCYHEFMKIPADQRQSKDFMSLGGKGN
jgi:hypothetical protein